MLLPSFFVASVLFYAYELVEDDVGEESIAQTSAAEQSGPEGRAWDFSVSVIENTFVGNGRQCHYTRSAYVRIDGATRYFPVVMMTIGHHNGMQLAEICALCSASIGIMYALCTSRCMRYVRREFRSF